MQGSYQQHGQLIRSTLPVDVQHTWLAVSRGIFKCFYSDIVVGPWCTQCAIALANMTFVLGNVVECYLAEARSTVVYRTFVCKVLETRTLCFCYKIFCYTSALPVCPDWVLKSWGKHVHVIWAPGHLYDTWFVSHRLEFESTSLMHQIYRWWYWAAQVRPQMMCTHLDETPPPWIHPGSATQLRSSNSIDCVTGLAGPATWPAVPQ